MNSDAMDCSGIDDCFVLGAPFSAPAEEHLRSCSGCRTMVDALSPKPVLPDQKRLDSIRGMLTGSLKRVRPLPSDGTLISIALGTFIAFALLAAIPVDYRGFHHLSAIQRLAYYAVIAICATFLSTSVVQEIIPAARRRVRPDLIVVLSLLALALVSFGLFPSAPLEHFVKLGVPCLRLGVLCAAVSGFLGYLLLRKGFATSPVRIATVVGFFAGLTGVAVLALHCPVQNAIHILVWHLGAMLVAGAGGALLGFWRIHSARSAR